MGAEIGFGVCESALEVLQGVARGDSAAEAQRHAKLGRELDHRREQVLHRGIAERDVGGASEVVVEVAVADGGDRPRAGLGPVVGCKQEPTSIEAEDGLDVAPFEQIPLRGARARHRLEIGASERRPLELARGGALKGPYRPALPLVPPDLLAQALSDAAVFARVGDLNPRSQRPPGEAGLTRRRDRE